jgi:predicted transglutaminase-like cysteine proteinase
MRRLSVFMVMSLALIFAPADAHAANVFQSGVPGSHGFAFFPFWQQVLTDMSPARLQAPQPQTNSCPNERNCVPAAWTTFLDSVRKLSRHDQLDAVNRWANARPYVEDIVNWGTSDYWETPAQFLSHGGDCEDYAIAKYFSLVKLGFSPDDLRIVIVDDTNMNVFHAVLAVRSDNNVWLLDNQLPQIVPMSLAVQYVPVYSLNERSWWMHSLPKINLGNIVIAAGSPNDGHAIAQN